MTNGRKGALAAGVAGLLTAISSAIPAVGNPALIPKSELVCRFDAKALPEISGLATSLTHKHVLWGTNDSGNGPYLYAIDSRNCKIRAKLRLLDTPARDHEALAVGTDSAGRSVIWIGDIGDNILNLGGWPYLRIHKVYEPRVLQDGSVPVTTYRFKYPDGAHDAETLIAAPKSEKLWVVTKDRAGGGIYALPSPMSASQTPMKVKKVGTARPLITDGAMSPDGRRFVLRDYLSAEGFSGHPPGTPKGRFALPLQMQGESISWSSDGKSLFVASEGSTDLLRVQVPASVLGVQGGLAALLPRVAGFDIYPVVRTVALVAGIVVLLVVARRVWRRR